MTRIDASDIDIRSGRISDISLPLMINSAGDLDLTEYINRNKQEVEAHLVKHGGILFRNFAVDTVEKFNTMVKCFDQHPIEYMFRSSPRYSLAEGVYISTKYPNDRSINMHSESSYSFEWGKKIIFGCIFPAATGGRTPIADNRKVLANLGKDLVDKFEKEGVIYQRNLIAEIGMRWQEVFQTENADEVKKTCREKNIQFKFLTKDNLLLRWKRPAIFSHPVTNEKTWFNHAFFFNKYSLLEEMQIPYNETSLYNSLPSDTFFGDSTEISHEEYLQIKEAYEKEKVSFSWEKGDVLLLDNMLSSHGREPYKGERQIVVSILEPAC
jgi:hypothetical protein